MSGGGGGRDDRPSSSSTGGGAEGGGGDGGDAGPPPADPCMKVRRGPINSPKQVILAALRVGSMLEVKVRFFGSSFALVVVDAGGALAGSLTFVGYLEVVDCIRNRGLDYTATVIGIAGGVYEVRVEPV